MDHGKVSLQEVLEFRELKADIQNEMISGTSHGVVVSLGMNIPGPVKSGPSIYEAFQEGRKSLENVIKSKRGRILIHKVLEEPAGYAAIYLTEGVCGMELKRACVALEEQHILGRIYDIDVTDENQMTITREMTGGKRRKCLLCSEDAKVCGRNRTHSAEELQKKVMEMIAQWKEGKSNESCAGN